MKNRAKNGSRSSAVNVPKHLHAARRALVTALTFDDDLEKFSVSLPEGHKLTLEDMHTWLLAVIEHYEKNGPRAEALKIMREKLATQFAARQ